jgi:hypothetical protein
VAGSGFLRRWFRVEVRCREGKWLGEEADGAAGPFGGPETMASSAGWWRLPVL